MKFGEQLKSAREQQGLTLADVAARTKIRADFLEALEQGDVTRLPERTFARGYLQRYARELNLEPSALLTDFDRLIPMSPEMAQAVRRAPRARRGPQLPAGLIATVLSGVVVVGALAWGGYAYYRSSTSQNGQAATEPTRVPLASSRQVRLSVRTQPAGARVYLDNVYLGTAPIANFPVDARDRAELRLERSGYAPVRQSVTLTADAHLSAKLQKGKATPAVPVTGASSAAGGVAATSTRGTSTNATSAATASTSATSSAGGVTLRFVGRSWVRVRAGSRTLYEGIPAPGSQQSFPAGVSVRVGSAGAVQFSVGGQPAQAFGPPGRPLTRTF